VLREAQAATKEGDLINSLALRVSDNGLLRQSFVGQLPETVGSIQRDRHKVLRDDDSDIPIGPLDSVPHPLCPFAVRSRYPHGKRHGPVVGRMDDDGLGTEDFDGFSPRIEELG
jgi:hypothetical protein